MSTPSPRVEPLSRPKIIRDPVHNFITLDGAEGTLILGLLAFPEFQRLRRIRQTGLSFLTYPGAEHSRFVHCLGVYHIARRMLDSLRDRHGEQSVQYAELAPLRREILVAAVLHDVGHGPFSHLFETAIKARRSAPSDHPRDHEDWSQAIIRGRFAPYLEANGVDVDVVTGLIDKKNRRHLLGKDFISSQLDADRMDYLLRDSRAAGPKYGDYDLEWLLHSLRIGKVGVRGQGEAVSRLCFDSQRAIPAVEEYIQAREFMYEQVYIHKTTRAYEAMFKNILGLATAIADGDPARVPAPCPAALAKMLAGQPVDLAEYLSLDDFRVWTTFLDWSGLPPGGNRRLELLANKCRRLVNRQRPYRVLELDNRDKQDRALELVTGLNNGDAGFSCHRDAFRDVAYRNVFYRKSQAEMEQEDQVIHVIDRHSQTHPVEAESAIIHATANIEKAIYRLYYDDEDQGIVRLLQKDGWLPGGSGHAELT